MVVKKNTNLIAGLAVSALVILSVGGSLYFLSLKKKHQATVESLHNANAILETKFQKIAAAYTIRNEYLVKLAARSDKTKKMVPQLQELNSTMLSTSSEIPKIEALSNKINQWIANEAASFNKTKRSNLFSQISEIRTLERYDRSIDVARNDFSNSTFEYMTKKKSLEKNVFFKSEIKDANHFPVDHLIRSSRTQK